MGVGTGAAATYFSVDLITAGVVSGSVGGAVGGAAQQATGNLLTGSPLERNVAKSAAYGGFFGLVTGGIGGGAAANATNSPLLFIDVLTSLDTTMLVEQMP